MCGLDEWKDRAEKAEKRVSELEARLEFIPQAPHIDGIFCRDMTIKLLDEYIAELELKVSDVQEPVGVHK